MGGELSLSIVEIMVLMLGAIVLGITIHFFIVSRKSLNDQIKETPGSKLTRELDDWKRRYFNDMEDKNLEIENLVKKYTANEDTNEINAIEADEMRKENKILKAKIEEIKNTTQTTSTTKPDYIEQLRIAQTGLLEHNTKITQLLNQFDIIKETEEKQKDIVRNNEELTEQIDELSSKLSDKEKELKDVRKKEHLTTEMNSMLDSAYAEFNTLQDKMLKLEMQVINARKINIEYEDVKEGYSKVSRDLEEEKKKYNAVYNKNAELREDLLETQDKLKETNFQRQQLQKKVAYLEELNIDMQVIADANKKLEGQIRRIGELESMLNVVSDERDDLARKQKI